MPDDPSPPFPILENIHASCVAVDGHGLLLIGPSGAGKSDLALRLIDRGAILVADDRCDIRYDGSRLFASPPEALAGLMEIRGLGILTQPHQKSVALSMAVQLAPSYDRYPFGGSETLVAGYPLPFVRLNAFEMSAPIKIMCALQTLSPRS
jgi:HPr kinase/phosphorylase